MSEQDRTKAQNTASPDAGRKLGDSGSGGGSTDTVGMRETAKREVEDAKTLLSETRSTVREGAVGAGEKLKTKAMDEAEHRKGEATGSLNVFAESIRSAADDLSRKDQSAAARVAHEAARGVESLSRAINEKSVADASRSLASYGREHPVAFVAGGLLAGMAVGRFLKASGDQRHAHDGHRYGSASRTPTSDDWTSRHSQSDSVGGARHAGPARPGPVGTPTASTRSTAVLGDNNGNP